MGLTPQVNADITRSCWCILKRNSSLTMNYVYLPNLQHKAPTPTRKHFHRITSKWCTKQQHWTCAHQSTLPALFACMPSPPPPKQTHKTHATVVYRKYQEVAFQLTTGLFSVSRCSSSGVGLITNLIVDTPFISGTVALQKYSQSWHVIHSFQKSSASPMKTTLI